MTETQNRILSSNGNKLASATDNIHNSHKHNIEWMKPGLWECILYNSILVDKCIIKWYKYKVSDLLSYRSRLCLLIRWREIDESNHSSAIHQLCHFGQVS